MSPRLMLKSFRSRAIARVDLEAVEAGLAVRVPALRRRRPRSRTAPSPARSPCGAVANVADRARAATAGRSGTGTPCRDAGRATVRCTVRSFDARGADCEGARPGLGAVRASDGEERRSPRAEHGSRGAPTSTSSRPQRRRSGIPAAQVRPSPPPPPAASARAARAIDATTPRCTPLRLTSSTSLLLGEEAEEPEREDGEEDDRLLDRHRHPAELLVLERVEAPDALGAPRRRSRRAARGRAPARARSGSRGRTRRTRSRRARRRREAVRRVLETHHQNSDARDEVRARARGARSVSGAGAPRRRAPGGARAM